MVISSKDNEQIRQIRKLREKKYRNQEKKYIIEGIKLVKEAITEGVSVKNIIVCEDCTTDGTLDKSLLYEIAKFNCLYVTKEVFKSISSVENPQGLLAIIEKRNTQQIDYSEDVIVILDNVQDPGNIGTILRTIDSVGLSQVIISNTTVDCYNPKVVRSTMGAIFRVNVIQSQNIIEILKEIKRHKFKICATSLEESKSIYDVEYKKVAIVMGNESKGVSKEILDVSEQNIKIPMLGKTESLNVAVATSVILYEYLRTSKV
ncbi:MAG: RNA methyltransferase [Clostridia bacterium]|nr:RNA methyltransferase [Clostridia bacterium]